MFRFRTLTVDIVEVVAVRSDVVRFDVLKAFEEPVPSTRLVMVADVEFKVVAVRFGVFIDVVELRVSTVAPPRTEILPLLLIPPLTVRE